MPSRRPWPDSSVWGRLEAEPEVRRAASRARDAADLMVAAGETEGASAARGAEDWPATEGGLLLTARRRGGECQ